MTCFLRYSILTCLILIPTLLSAGGPWAEGKGKGFVETGALFNIGTENLDHTYQIYSEFGLIEKLTFKFVLPLKNISSPENIDVSQVQKGQLFGVGNVILGLKYEFFKKKIVLSAGLDTELRTISAFDDFGLRTGYEKYTFRPNFSVGWGIDNVYAYGEIRPGFSTNSYGHDINFVSEIGGKVDENVWLAAYFEIKGVFNNGNFNDNDAEAYQLTGYFQDRQNFYSLGVKFSAILYQGFGLNAGLFYGKGVNQPDGGGAVAIKVGLFYDW